MSVRELDRCRILGVNIVAAPLTAIVDDILHTLTSDDMEPKCMCPTGVHGIIEARKDSALLEVLNSATYALADGMPLVRVARLRGFKQAERAFGPHVMWTILQRSAGIGSRHFFYGGQPGVAQQLAEKARRTFPGLEVAGSYCPPFRALSGAEELDIARTINLSRADVVWVGLSTPKQEKWIGAMRDRLRCKLVCSVGAAFDYHTGRLKVAPRWMQAASVEWMLRLVQEPGRLWRRYAEIVPKFMVLESAELARFWMGRLR